MTVLGIVLLVVVVFRHSGISGRELPGPSLAPKPDSPLPALEAAPAPRLREPQQFRSYRKEVVDVGNYAEFNSGSGDSSRTKVTLNGIAINPDTSKKCATVTVSSFRNAEAGPSAKKLNAKDFLLQADDSESYVYSFMSMPDFFMFFGMRVEHIDERAQTVEFAVETVMFGDFGV